MTREARVVVSVDTPAIKKAIAEAAARAVNEAAHAIRAVRDWCDKTEVLPRGHLSWPHAPGMCCARSQTLLDTVAEIRALLPPAVPEAAGEVEDVADRDLL